MHCKACDAMLKEHELSRTALHTGEFIDLCDGCLETIPDVIYYDENALKPGLPEEELDGLADHSTSSEDHLSQM